MTAVLKRPARSTASLMLLLGVPTALLFLIGGYVLYALLSESADRLNETQHAGEQRLARSFLHRYQGELSNVVGDYSFWDEMYDFFLDTSNTAWANDNLGPYVATAFGAEHTLAVSTEGEIVYGYHGDAEGEVPESDADRQRLKDIALRAFATRQPGAPSAISGMVEYRGMPHFIAASAVAVSAAERIAAGEQPHVALILMRPIDTHLMSNVAADFGLEAPHVDRHLDDGVEMLDPLGRPTGYALHWTTRDVGADFLASITPSVFTLIGIGFATVLCLGFIWFVVLGRVHAIEARAEAAEQTSAAKNLFLANMSHELRTPLNSIIGFSEILASQAFGPLGGDNYVEYARDIQVSGRHLLGVVNDILLMSKLDAGQHQIAIEEIALEEIVRESRRMVAADAKARGVDLKVCATCEPLEVLGGHQALRQILVNVLGNAVKFSPEGETVEIVWSRLNPAQCRLTIADRGCGMPADVIARLGKPFNQSDDSFTRSHQGSGLGLAISLGLAKAMDMALDVSSEPGRGTTVSLTLRLAEGQRDVPAHRTLPPRDLPRAA